MTKLPKYPDDYFDFSQGFDIKNDQINLMIRDAYERLQSKLESEEYPTYSIGTGNVMVVVTITDKATGDYTVQVNKNYQEFDSTADFLSAGD